MVEIKTDAALEAMREAGRVVAHALAAAEKAAGVGVSLRELDEAARAVLDAAGATSPFLGYHPSFAPHPLPRGHLRLRQRRRRARHPRRLPAARRRPGQHRLRGGGRRLGGRRRRQLRGRHPRPPPIWS
ncbi:hypothetical protein GCM10020000_72570 [Streptomyces olivoverticillatus]